MSDEFDRFLASSLAPPARMPDRRFVSGVQAAIALDERLAAERRAVAGGLLKQLAALLSISAAIWIIGQAPPISPSFAQSPGFALVSVLVAVVCVVALISSRPAAGIGAAS